MDEACPLPSAKSVSERDAVRAMVAMRRIAVVGMTPDAQKAGHYVPEFLMGRGKDVVPVNPNYAEVLGERCYATLSAVPGEIDVVLVFRRPEFCAGVARDAVGVKAKGLWLQSGIYSEEAKRIAEEAGMLFVQGRCMMVEAR